ALSGSGCPLAGSVVDFFGYGTANCSEGSVAAALTNTTAALRAAGGCTDADNNASDFATGAPNPRNTATVSAGGPGPTNPTGSGAASPVLVHPGATTLLTVAVSPGQNPTSSGLSVTANLTAIGGAAAQTLFDDHTHGDAAAGDNVFSFLATAGPATGLDTVPITITDAQGRTGSTTVTLTVQDPAPVVISQVYGGGGNSGSTFTNDFIELFNRTSAPVSLAGWSVQYASAGGATWDPTPLSGSIGPGQYYLVQEGAGGAGTVSLSPDAVGGSSLSASAGKVALVRATAPLTGSGCPF